MQSPPTEASPPELVDTHAHLDDAAFDPDRPQVIERARQAGVNTIVLIGYRQAIWDRTIGIARSFDGGLIALGVHPGNADEFDDGTIDRLRVAITDSGAVAIGETGIDLLRDGPPLGLQERVFRAQLDLAVELGLPTIIHQRAAELEALAVLRETPIDQTIVMHSFDASERTAAVGRERGWYVGVGGLMTRVASEGIRHIIHDYPLDRLLLETDAPYLVPTGVRMRRNEPANVAVIAARLARLRGLSVAEVARATTANARRVFGARRPAGGETASDTGSNDLRPTPDRDGQRRPPGGTDSDFTAIP